jgi:hypothetical protein
MVSFPEWEDDGRCEPPTECPCGRWLSSLGAVAASVAALWITLSADFLSYPGWLAVQKADFILGPVLAGVYWDRRRPQSRFGPMLIGFGFLGALHPAVGEQLVAVLARAAGRDRDRPRHPRPHPRLADGTARPAGALLGVIEFGPSLDPAASNDAAGSTSSRARAPKKCRHRRSGQVWARLAYCVGECSRVSRSFVR